MPQCKFCGAEIIWMKSKKGKNVPIDPDSILNHSATVYDSRAMTCHFNSCKKMPPKQEERTQPNDHNGHQELSYEIGEQGY